MKDIFPILEKYWLITSVSASVLLIIIIFIEIKGMNSYGVKRSILQNKYLKKHQYMYHDDQYRKFQHYFDSFSYISVNNPKDVIMQIHSLMIDCLKNNFHSESVDITSENIHMIVKNPELYLFTLNPSQWFNNHFSEYQPYFYDKNDKIKIKIGLALLSPVFNKLEKLIFKEISIKEIDGNWDNYNSYIKKLKFQHKMLILRKYGIYIIFFSIIGYIILI